MPPRSRASRRLARLGPEYGPLEPPAKRPRMSPEVLSPGDQAHVAARSRIETYTPKHGRDDANLKKCLYAFLDFLPPSGAIKVADDILECGSDDDLLFQVFQDLLGVLLVPMKTSITSPVDPLEEPAENHATPEQLFRDDCLRRDGYHCVISQAMDRGRWANLGYPETEPGSAPVDAAHIIPYSYADFEDNEGPPKDITKRWEALYQYFPALKETSIGAANINDLGNGLTLMQPLHEEFRNFTLAFQPMDEIHTYRIKTYPSFATALRSFLPQDRILKLRLASQESQHDLQLPNPQVLAVHFAIAEILHASGMGREIDRVMQDVEDLGFLDPNGSTDAGQLVSTALWAKMA